MSRLVRGGHRLPRRLAGQTLVMAALAMVALLAFVGLVLNMGLFLVERRHLQNAADAIALAATWRVLDEQTSRGFVGSEVLAEAQRLAVVNEVTQRTLTASYVDQSGTQKGIVDGGTMPPDAAGVRVNLGGPFETLLAGFVGRDTIHVSADSEARLVPVVQPTTLAQPAGLLPVVPIAVPLTDYQGAAAYDLYHLPYPYLDLTTAANGGTPAPSYGDVHTNLQYWSDGSHATGTLVVGSDVMFAVPFDASYASDVQTGLNDNVRRQSLPYILISVPLCSPCSATKATVVGFARFNLAANAISLSHLVGSFVPFANDLGTVARRPGPLWGPSTVALTR